MRQNKSNNEDSKSELQQTIILPNQETQEIYPEDDPNIAILIPGNTISTQTNNPENSTINSANEEIIVSSTLPIVSVPMPLSQLDILKIGMKTTLPIVGNRVFTTAGNFLGGLMLAKLSHEALAASALIAAVQNVIIIVSTSPLMAVSSIVGNGFGAIKVMEQKNAIIPAQKKAYELGGVLQQGQVLAILTSIPTMAIMCFVGPTLELLGQPKPIADIVQQFFSAYLWSVPANALLTSSQQFAMSVESQLLVFGVGLVGFSAVTAFGYAFVFGEWGFPALGAAGLGYSSSIRSWLSLITIEAAFLIGKKYKPYSLFKPRLRETLPFLKELWSIGWPISLQYGGEVSSMLATTVMIGHLGTIALAARAVSSQYQLLLVVPLFALSQAGTVLVSQAWGKKQYDDLKKFGYTQIAIGSGVSILVFASFVAFKKAYISFFLDDKDPHNQPIVSLLDEVLLITMGGYVLDSIRNIAGGALRGLKDTKFTSLSSIISLWFIGLPLAYCLGFAAAWGLGGVAIANDVGMAFGAATLFNRWRSKSNEIAHIKKNQNEIPAPEMNYCARIWNTCMSCLGFGASSNGNEQKNDINSSEPLAYPAIWGSRWTFFLKGSSKNNSAAQKPNETTPLINETSVLPTLAKNSTMED